MKCLKCGTELREDAKFCKSCGSEVKANQPLGNSEMDCGESKLDFADIIKHLSNYAADYSQKVNEIEKLKRDNEVLEQELEKKDDLIHRKNEENKELQDNVKKLRLKIEELENELNRLIRADDIQNAGADAAVITSCPNCGCKVDENTVFCGECGTKIR